MCLSWHEHAKVRSGLIEGEETKDLGFDDPDFVLHALRHTMLTRLGESGADPYTIMKIAGHSSIIVSQRYVHPTPERMESAFAQMETMNQIMRGDEEAGGMLGVPTESTNDDRS